MKPLTNDNELLNYLVEQEDLGLLNLSGGALICVCDQCGAYADHILKLRHESWCPDRVEVTRGD